jgi:Tfp pilus assembly protein PilW
MLTTCVWNRNAEVAIGVICTCLPALSALLKRALNEYSSDKQTYESEYKLSSMNNQAKTERSRKQITVQEAESDEDMLVSNAQSNPTQTMIYGDAEERGFSHASAVGGIGITRTVNVSTSVESRPH